MRLRYARTDVFHLKPLVPISVIIHKKFHSNLSLNEGEIKERKFKFFKKGRSSLLSLSTGSSAPLLKTTPLGTIVNCFFFILPEDNDQML